MDKNSLTVLIYHSIVSKKAVLPPQREVGAELYDLSLENFDRQMAWLASNGYKAVSLRDANQPPDKNIVITFDDGEMNNFTEALPILQKYHFPAYFFIIAKRIGKPGYMGLEELKALHQSGMMIGSHGLSHEVLTNLVDTQIEEELKASKRVLELNLDIQVDSLSIPRGFCDDKIIQMAYALGYKHIFISDRPRKLQSPCFSRTAVKGTWDLARFKRAIQGEVTLGESLADTIKRIAKKILREDGYNFLRNLIIKIIR